MGLQPGTRIGRYEILALVGVGGMGEVYRARDERLHRDVAIKVLPPQVSADPDRLARFEREARLLAALNHSSIAQIHGLEDAAGVRALVMEFVDGATLADRIAQGALAIGDALPIALQIADALASAHERGIVHRDLKPANIKVGGDGSVKVLDFGLAKANDAAEPAGHPTRSPTITSPAALTAHGIVLGTIAYMAPEQARGAAVDKRADIWAFGCVLFEMLAGGRAFPGDSVAETVAHVLKGEPDWTRLPVEMPPSIRRLLRRCLEKDPKQRLHDFADVRLEIRDALTARTDEADGGGAVGRPRAKRAWAAIAAGSVAAAATAAIVISLPRSPTPAPELRVDIATPPTSEVGSIALSPDGAAVAYAASEHGRRRLWLRSLTSAAARELDGTDGAMMPFWAPNGRSIGFFADDGRLKRVDIEGGTIRALATAPLPWGGTWGPDDTIVFAPVTGGLSRISANGGRPEAVTKLKPGQVNHSFPWFLPDGRHLLYYVSGGPDVRGVYVSSADGSDDRRLVDTDAVAICATGGHVLFVRGTTLLAQPIDMARAELRGSAFPVAESIAMQPAAGAQVAALTASWTGQIAYRTGTDRLKRQFMWVDRSGRELQKVGDADDANPLSPNLSRDQRRLAMHRTVGGNIDLWLLDTERGVRTRVTSNAANDIHPLWAPDGRRMLFSSNRNGSYELYEKILDAEGAEKRLLAFQSPPTDWSADGTTVLVQRRDVNGSADIWALPIATGQPFPVVQTPEFDERDAQFSPDGKWIAYASTESGRWEIYVQAFPTPRARVQVSINGGSQPRWRPDGQELFFVALDGRLMAVRIALADSGSDPRVTVPAALFATRIGGAIQGTSRQQYFVSRDGSRFLLNTIVDAAPPAPITLILNWNPVRNRQ